MTSLREVSIKLMEAVDEGMLTWQQIAEAALRYMPEDEVADMAKKNELLMPEEDLELYDEDEEDRLWGGFMDIPDERDE